MALLSLSHKLVYNGARHNVKIKHPDTKQLFVKIQTRWVFAARIYLASVGVLVTLVTLL